LAAVLAGERRTALGLVLSRGVDSGLSVEDLRCEIVQETQREIGRLWQENRISVAQEHQATAISQVVLARLYDLAPHVPRNGKKVLAACVEGEQHDFPCRLVSDALDLAGFDVKYLGANVPTVSLCERVRAEQPDLVVLSVTMVFNVPALRQAVAALREVSSATIAVGGAACLWSQGTSEKVAADLCAESARELVALAQAQLGVAA
jgi:methanogenic corrinoid protein MtbC1